MPQPESTHRLQDAVLWAQTGVDRYGEPVVGTAQAIKVRFNAAKKRVLTPEGKTITLDGTAIVNQAIAVGSLLFIGTLTTYVGTGSGSGSDDAQLLQVKSYNDTPDIKNRSSLKEVGLMRFRNALP